MLPARLLICWIIAIALLVAASFTRDARAAARPPSPAAVEIIPTARREPATWRYVFDKPADNWAAREFDDAAWRRGRGGFGTTPGTPGIVANTVWGYSRYLAAARHRVAGKPNRRFHAPTARFPR
jgi:hypothetical protein